MPQLDRLLSLLVTSGADAIHLVENDAARMIKGAVAQPLTKQPLAAAQLIGLLREIAPGDASRDLDAGLPARFEYRMASGTFVADAAPKDGRWEATLSLAPAPAAVAPPPPPPPAMAAGPVAPLVAAAPAMPAAPFAPRVSMPLATVSAEHEREAEGRALMDELLRLMVIRQASDLHLRCGEPPIVRQHGEMARVEGYNQFEPAHLEVALRSIMPQRNRDEFAEKNDTDFAYEIPDLARFRSNVLRDHKGPAAVFRVIPSRVVTVEELGLSQEVQNLCQLSKGLVLVTGPTGSGKSTTLCGLVDLVNRTRSDHIITIEDPIEFVHQNKSCVITQRQVGVHTASFKNALRAALREDPDIVLVGELRDLETVSIAIETAETGHLVFGTLHTTTAASTIDRVIDQFSADRQEQIRTMLSESLKGVISQVLCRKIGGGRVAAREILLTNPAVSNLIREAKTFQIPSVMQTSRRLGMTTLNDALLDLVDANMVEPREAYLKSADKSGLVGALKTRGHDTSFLESDGTKPDPAAAPAKAPPGPTPRPVAGVKR